MKNLFNNISESEKNRILEMHSGKKNVISEQGIGSGPRPYPGTPKTNQPIDLGFEKWGNDGFILRLPKGSLPNKNTIRITAQPSLDEFNVGVAVQSNKKVRSEINGVQTFKEIENLLKNRFIKMDNVYDIVHGQVQMNVLKKIVDKLSQLKVDEKNNTFVM